jgi:hypothetical protein
MSLDDLKLTPRLEFILGLAAMEREADKSEFTSAEHVLIGILLDDRTSASMLLKEKGFTVEKLRNRHCQKTRNNKPK